MSKPVTSDPTMDAKLDALLARIDDVVVRLTAEIRRQTQVFLEAMRVARRERDAARPRPSR